MNKYQWPASRLDQEEMALLFREKQKSKKSICELLRGPFILPMARLLAKRITVEEK